MLRNKTLKATVFLLAVLAFETGAGLVLSQRGGTETAKADTPGAEAGQQGADEAKSDLDRVQGTWRVVSSQVGDEKAAEDEVKRRKITVKGNVLTYDYGTGDPKRVGTLKLDPKTKYLDWNVTVPEAGTMLALYEIKGDEWKIGFGNDGVIRPRSWAIGKDDVVWLLVLKREKPEKDTEKKEALKHSNEAFFALVNGDYGKAIAEATEAIRFDPESRMAYLNRGSAYVLKGEPGKAIKDFDRVIQLDPKDVRGYDNRAAAYAAKGAYRKAVEGYREAMRVGPEKYEPYAYLAEVLATCPDRDLRDGKKAVELATRACELTKWNDFTSLSALAAAYAEVGDFKKAVEWQKKAMKATGTLVYKTKHQEEEISQRLKNYEDGKPFRRQAAGGAEKGATNGDDQKALRGTWRVVSIESEGVKSQAEGSYTLTFHTDHMHQLHKVTNGADFHYSFKLDSSKSPRTIDMTITKAGSEKDKGEVGKTLLGIYALEGDSLKLCIDPKVRPTTFDTKGNGRGTVLMILKRDRE